MSKATSDTTESDEPSPQQSRQTDAQPTAVTFTDRYGYNMPAVHRHRVRDVVARLEEAFDHNDVITPTVYQSASGICLKFSRATVVSTSVIANALPYNWRVEMLAHSNGDVRVMLYSEE